MVKHRKRRFLYIFFILSHVIYYGRLSNHKHLTSFGQRFFSCQIVCLILKWCLPKLDDVCVYSIVRLKYCMRSKSLLFLGPWCWWETKQHVSAVKAQNNCHKTVFTSFRRWNRIARRNYNWYEDILQFIFDNECFDEQIKRII